MTALNDLAIEQWPLDRLLPYAANARTHSDHQMAQIASSIAAFGFNVPCLVDEHGVLIAGHGRLLAARQLELETVPVIRLEHLSEVDARAFRIGDNRIAENAGWDEDFLGDEFKWLRGEADFDLDVTGFTLNEVNRLQQEDDLAGKIDDDEASEPPEQPITRPGDLWLLGGHRLLCGDATVLADVERALDGELADLCFTDPPYNVDYGNSANDRMRGKRRPIRNDNLGADFERFLGDACLNILAVTKGAAYVCMSSSELPTLQRAFREAGGHWSTFVIWAKNTFTLGRADYQRQYEPILSGWKEGTDHYWCGARDQGDVWFVDKPARNDLHPTMKPVALVERALRNSSKSRDVVLDPFAGSGSTAIAAEKTCRAARLVELDPGYCDVIVRRWQDWTGQAASLDGEDGSFEQVNAERRGDGQGSAAR